MNISKTIYLKNREAWRAWLEKHHDREKEIWITFYKKHTGKPCVSYNDAVEEALCFGWIDSIVKRIDEEKYAQKFSVRKESSAWSDSNRKRVQKMIEEGRMTDAGRAKLSEAFYQPQPKQERKKFSMPSDLKAALNANPQARENFARFAPGYQQNYFHWIITAKREETRTRRIAEAVELIAKNTKVLLK
jgi:uncharacterized protein YdeI (YjbR/CyaY-like superfamily)